MPPAMAEGHSSKVVLFTLGANAVIALAKGVAAVFTRSGSMLAETIHSLADCLNQVLLLVGLRQSAKGPSEQHPLGTGRASYFWSFQVALMLFFGGGVYSIVEGVEKMLHPSHIDKPWIALAILGFSLVLEGFSLYKCLAEIDKKRGTIPRRQFLMVTKDAELVVVTGENAAATLGLGLAFVAVLLGAYVHPFFDGLGSLLVGVVLVGVAWFLAKKIKSLLLGERADPDIENSAREAAREDPRLAEILRLITVQQGPGEVMIAAKIRVADGVSAADAASAINALEERIRKRQPEVRWQFIEVDVNP